MVTIILLYLQEQIMKRKHNKYSPEFKAKVAKAALKEEATLSELSQLYQVPVNQISK
jgi:transposase-like protein